MQLNCQLFEFSLIQFSLANQIMILYHVFKMNNCQQKNYAEE